MVFPLQALFHFYIRFSLDILDLGFIWDDFGL